MNYLVVGCGHSGISAIRLLKKKKHNVFAYDDFPCSKQTLKQLNLLNVPLLHKKEIGSLNLLLYTIVISPGVALTHWLIKKAPQHTPIISELELALSYYKGKILAITGTNGKSTTAKMCHHTLKKLSVYSALAGNFGESLSAVLVENRSPDILVLELSSYQIEQTKTIHPDVSIFTTFSEDHLERHKTMSNYFSIKWRIFNSKKQNFRGFCSQDIISQYKKYNTQPIFTDNISIVNNDSTPLITHQSTKIKERHNINNALLAASACSYLTKTNMKTIASHLKSFKSIPHRYENLGMIEDILIINDSKATNIESTLAALEATPGPIMLLLGGISKNKTFTPLLKYTNKISHLITFGRSAQLINKSLHLHFPLSTFLNLKTVMINFCDILKKTDCCSVLFSPAGASQDEFIDFEERGRFFSQQIRSVMSLKNRKKNEHRKTPP